MERSLLLLICLSSVTSLASCTRDWGHKEAAPAEAAEATEIVTTSQSYTMPGLDHGLVQSPVNILSRRAKGGVHQIALNYDEAAPNYLENKGHTIELDFPTGSSITFDGKEYQLKQLHFHTPSEHQIDGITYPMEMHVVNMMDAENPDDPPYYLVISFLYRMGDTSPFIARFLKRVPTEEGGEPLETEPIDLSGGADMDLDYYYYRGSLTTPPHTETVEWLVVKQIQQASPGQIRRINLIEGDNARHVQALYGRKVD
jgi:carbonic anhydrase